MARGPAAVFRVAVLALRSLAVASVCQKQTNEWSVTVGDCCIGHRNCLTSPNYPDRYGNNQECVITRNYFHGPATVYIEHFDVEGLHDYLTINGRSYHGELWPRGGRLTKQDIRWSSDESVVRFGWRICPGSAEAQEYADLGPGMCLNPQASSQVKVYRDRASENEAQCRSQCDGRVDCHGYSASNAQLCYLYVETGLTGGGEYSDGVHCFVKLNTTTAE
eukprot:CAMPEP_0195127278 /NCGR_PEP_ID=MMETSP0448-20130528/136665_1 /TAXON_ID=66468 /ORGANISM="Heterocapsa triquestra, Strain CCMP 448" /LENGTH=219 /DNA_ID=CAMNT_0040165007 /DNA_START=9 /DNA_END=665 /DNA_ORIENTATION=-